MMDQDASELGELEREVMQLVWGADGVTADAIRDRLPRKPKESTVRTVLTRLEKKGFVEHSVVGRTFVFRAVEARQAVAARAVKRLIDWLCNGSVEEVLVGMADARIVDRETLQRLADQIEERSTPK